MTNDSGVTRSRLDELLRDKRGISVAELVEDLGLDVDETLFWSGSWVEGFANTKSDVDLYLVGSADRHWGGAELTGPGLPPMYLTLSPGRVRLDITVVPPELIDAAAAFLVAFDADHDYPVGWSENFREFVHRLRIGVPIVNAGRFEAVRATVDFAKFARYLVRYYHNRADSLLDDVLGLLDEGDHVSAYFAARQRMETTIDMLLVSRGQTNTRVDKWRVKKLMRLAEPDHDVMERFLAVEGVTGVAGGLDDDLKARVHAMLSLADELVLRAI